MNEFCMQDAQTEFSPPEFSPPGLFPAEIFPAGLYPAGLFPAGISHARAFSRVNYCVNYDKKNAYLIQI